MRHRERQIDRQMDRQIHIEIFMLRNGLILLLKLANPKSTRLVIQRRLEVQVKRQSASKIPSSLGDLSLFLSGPSSDW